jgi:hypothetical protein
MNATDQAHAKLLNAYRMALSVWSEARALYSPDDPEVVAANEHLDALEEELTLKRPAVLAA